MAQQRNNAISIAKGFAIIFVVMAHADMPGMLNRAIYLFHMPLFFITAGYFFKHETVENPWPFIVKRFKGLYVPFVKWSIFFLLIHNLLFKIGILNEVYGNWTGGTTHPYSIHQFWQRLTNIVFSMGGYDEFLAGAFWFFRGLLVASIAFVVLYYMLNNVRTHSGDSIGDFLHRSWLRIVQSGRRSKDCHTRAGWLPRHDGRVVFQHRRAVPQI